MLYKTETITNLDPSKLYTIDSGNLNIIPLTLTISGIIEIDLVHAGQIYESQDHSIRAWVSKAPSGQSVRISPPNVAYWHPNRINNEKIYLFEHTAQNPNTTSSIELDSGIYYLNILNLVNKINLWRCKITNL